MEDEVAGQWSFLGPPGGSSSLTVELNAGSTPDPTGNTIDKALVSSQNWEAQKHQQSYHLNINLTAR